MNKFTFVDLFAGIGGIRKGFENQGGRCIFTSEWDKFSQKTYFENYPQFPDHTFVGDITDVHTEDIPDFDVLLAGFPCQPFSIAGVSKKNNMGEVHGFEDKIYGTLFFDVARIIGAKRPQAFLLENVKNLISHDKGNTFKIIMDILEKELGYHVKYKVIDGQHFVPQHRERIMIVGFRDHDRFSFKDVCLPKKGRNTIADILHKFDGSEPYIEHDNDRYYKDGRADERYTLSDKLWTYLQNYAAKHKAKGNGFGFGLVTGDSVARSLSARYYKDGAEILVYQGDDRCPRRLTPRECARLMGFPDDFKIPVSDTQAYKQFGNSVVVPMVDKIAQVMGMFLN